jgi:hypothetical protein
MRRRTRIATAATVAAMLCTMGAGLISPGAASAAAPDGLKAIQAAGAQATSERIASLNTAIAKITADGTITDADRTTILATLNGDVAGMQTLAAKIAADTTVPQAKADYQSIFTQYRVYAVALPQSRYAASADDLTGTALPKLTAAHDDLAALLSGPYKAKDTPTVQAELEDMAAKIADATDALDGLAAAALAVTPAEYDANHAALVPIRASLKSALADAAAARADANKIVAAL